MTRKLYCSIILFNERNEYTDPNHNQIIFVNTLQIIINITKDKLQNNTLTSENNQQASNIKDLQLVVTPYIPNTKLSKSFRG